MSLPSLSRRLGAGAVLCAAAAAALTGCSSGQTTNNPNTSGTTHKGPIKILYIQKQGSQDYFVDEMNGAKAAASKAGSVTITPVDVNMVNAATVSAVRAAKAQGDNGIVIVPPDGSTGPQDTALAKSEGIPIISSDDDVCTNQPNPDNCKTANLLPRVGFDAQQMGTSVGQEAGTLFKQRSGWTASNTKILEEWQHSTTVCTPRVTYADKLLRQDGGPNAASLPAIKLDTDNNQSGDPQSAQSETAATINANHGVQHWVVVGCNDQNVAGAVNALSEAGVSSANILSVGLGGDVACKGWGANASNAMNAALLLNGYQVGYDAVTAMVKHVRSGAAFPPLTTVSDTMATQPTWKSSGFICH